MIQAFVDAFFKGEDKLKSIFSAHPEEYKDIVKAVITVISENLDVGEYAPRPDPKRIHEINDGGYQGYLLYLIAADVYQPSDYWFVRVGYGSCSGCDALQAIRKYSAAPPTEQQVKDYMTLALHIVQGMKQLPDIMDDFD